MKKVASILWVVLILAVQTMGQSPASQPTTAASESGTREASCVVQITFNPSSLSLNAEIVKTILYSLEVTSQAAKEVLAVKGDVRDYVSNVHFERIESAPDPVRAVLTARLGIVLTDSALPRAKEVLENIVLKLQMAIRNVYQDGLVPVRYRLEQAENEVHEAKQKLDELRRGQHNLTEAGQFDLSRKQMLDMIHGLEREKQEIAMNLAGKRARQRAIEEQIARVGKRIEEQLQSDRLLFDLNRLGEMREQHKESLMKATPDAKPGPAMGARIELDEKIAAAWLQYAQRREMVMRNSGGDILGKLNTELVTLTIDIAEMEECLHRVDMRLEDIRKKRLLELSDDYEDIVTVKIPLARQEMERAMREKEQCRHQLNAPGPSITVIGLTARP